MGFLEALTLILVLGKLAGVSISWFMVFLPLIIALVGYFGLFVAFLFFGKGITDFIGDFLNK